MLRCLLLWGCTQVFRSLALRLSTADVPPDELGSGRASLHRSELELEVARLPSVEQYTREWARFYSADEHLQDPLPPSVQLVLGVMTVAQDSEYREVVRQTWMRQAGVCYWQAGPRQGCSVYVAFVIGMTGSGTFTRHVSDEEMALAHSEEGMLALDIVENMNSGKSLAWFAAALKMFPWATHVGKMDMDTYPYVHKLVYRMEANRSCVGRDSPYEIIGRPSDWCELRYCAPWSTSCPRQDCHGQFLADGDGSWDDLVPIGSAEWRFFMGELYIMSLPLVRHIDWTPIGGNEDLVVSRGAESALQRLNSCAAFRRLDAWVHSPSWRFKAIARQARAAAEKSRERTCAPPQTGIPGPSSPASP